MQPTLCTRCKKRVAVVFISKIEKGETVNEGLCLKCAKDLGLPQVNDMMRRMGITDEDLDMISDEMMHAFGGAESMEGLPGRTRRTTARTAKPPPSPSSTAYSAAAARPPRPRAASSPSAATSPRSANPTSPPSGSIWTATAST